MTSIFVQDCNEVLEIQFADVRKYHGKLALMAVAVGFRSLEAAFRELFKDGAVPERKALSVISGHAGPGFRDAFEFVTRAVTRGAYTVDVNYPQGQYDPYRPQGYAFVISTNDGSAVEVVLKENFLPHEFYGYLKKGRDNAMTEADTATFEHLKASLSEQALAASLEDLFYIRRIQ